MSTSIIKGFYYRQLTKCNEIQPNDEYKSSIIASQKELGISIPDKINLKHTRYTHLLATK